MAPPAPKQKNIPIRYCCARIFIHSLSSCSWIHNTHKFNHKIIGQSQSQDHKSIISKDGASGATSEYKRNTYIGRGGGVAIAIRT